jgi:hypothetical protein
MALTRVAPAGIGSTPGTGYVIGDSFLHSRGVNTIDGNYTGIVTAQSIRVIGDLEVEGTTTTLDTALTEVDKLEVGANNNTVGVAITQSGTGDILNLYDGATEVFSVLDGGAVRIDGNVTVNNSRTNTHASLIIDKPDAGTGTLKFFNNGSASAYIQHTNAEHLDYYLPSGSGNHSFYTNGANERLSITSGGNIGINETSPQQKLHVGGDVQIGFNSPTDAARQIIFNSNRGSAGATIANLNWEWNGTTVAQVRGIAGADTTNKDNAHLAFFTAPSGSLQERLRITSSGNVGIGTDNPARKVEIFDTAATVLQLNSTNTGGTSLRIQNSGTDKMYMGLAGDFIVGQANNVTDSAIRASGSLLFASGGGTERLRITSSGDVLFDTTNTNPTANNADGTAILSGGGIRLSRDGEPLGLNRGGSDGVFIDMRRDGTSKATMGVTSNALQFSTAGTERLRITSGGQSKFTVGTNKYVKIYAASHNDEADVGAGIAFSRPSDGADMLSGIFAHSNTGLGIAARDHITILTGGTSNVSDTEERLRITSDGKVGINVTVPQQKLDVVGLAHTVAVFRPDASTTSAYGNASAVNNLINLRMPYGSNPGSTNNNGARWGIIFQGRNDGAEYGTDSSKSASIYAVSQDATAGYNRQVGLAFYTSDFDANQTERLRIRSDGKLMTQAAGYIYTTSSAGSLSLYGGNTNLGGGIVLSGGNTNGDIRFYAQMSTSSPAERVRITSGGDVNILGGILNLGTIGQHSAHINSPELMSFNIDTDNDDSNRYFIFKKDAATNAGTELMRLTEGGNLGIGGVDPAAGDGGNSNYNNWDIPKLHVKGPTNSGKFHLLGRFESGVDADSTGAQIVIHHENDRGMALQGGRSSGNRSYGAIKSLDNLSRESNVMVFTGGNGQGVENIKFYTNGASTGTNERMSINTYGTVHTGGSTEITQTSLKPDLITQAGVVSPMFYRPFQSMSGAPSTSGPGYVDFGTGGVRHNLTDPHLGASYGGSQFQGGLIGSYSQQFSNTAAGTIREAMNWNRFRILFRGLCLSTSHTPPTVKFRYSTYHYSNGWQDHSGTEWSFNGTEQARGGRWVVGPWINPSSYFTNWADVPGFGLYYNDNSSGKTFRIAGGVYFQFAHFI